jgi:hypothetical protein
MRVGVDSFTPETDLSAGNWRREMNYDVPSILQEVWKHELRGDYCKFLERYDKELKFGDTLTDIQKEDFRLLLFIFRKAASVNPKAPTPIRGHGMPIPVQVRQPETVQSWPSTPVTRRHGCSE